jgi:hypothetical protein
MEVLDWKYYISKYPDLRNAGITTRRRAIAHWHKSGKYEHRYPSRRYERMIERKHEQNNNKEVQDIKLKNIIKKNKKYHNSDISESYGDIKSFVDKQNHDFTESDDISDMQNINTYLLEENNDMLSNILKKISILSDTILILNEKINNISKRKKNNRSKSNTKNISVNDLSNKIVSSDEQSNNELENLIDSDDIVSNSSNKKKKLKYHNIN